MKQLLKFEESPYLVNDLSLKQKLEIVVHLMSVEPDSRNDSHITILLNCLKEIRFFEELIQNNEGRQIAKQCCKHIYYQNAKSEEFVIKEKEKGDRFYVILSGEVRITHVEWKISEEGELYKYEKELGK